MAARKWPFPPAQAASPGAAPSEVEPFLWSTPALGHRREVVSKKICNAQNSLIVLLGHPEAGKGVGQLEMILRDLKYSRN